MNKAQKVTQHNRDCHTLSYGISYSLPSDLLLASSDLSCLISAYAQLTTALSKVMKFMQLRDSTGMTIA